MVALAEPVADLEDVVDRLTEAAPELRGLGVEALTVFGSFATGSHTAFSDVDFVVEPRPQTFRDLMKIEDRLGDLMMRKVDVLTPKAVKPYMRDAIERSGRRIVL